MSQIYHYALLLSTHTNPRNGNDTIDCYPLIATGAKKILCITDETYTAISLAYKTFRAFIKRPAPKNIIKAAKNLRPEKIILQRERQPAYEPSNAIHTNTCDYRRWCRVTEWFNQFKETQNRSIDSIKMDT